MKCRFIFRKLFIVSTMISTVMASNAYADFSPNKLGSLPYFYSPNKIGSAPQNFSPNKLGSIPTLNIGGVLTVVSGAKLAVTLDEACVANQRLAETLISEYSLTSAIDLPSDATLITDVYLIELGGDISLADLGYVAEIDPCVIHVGGN